MEEFDLDERMTDESRTFVINYLKKLKPINLMYRDIELSRKTRTNASIEANSSLKFENLKEKEIKIHNKKDGYEIPVSIYIPEDVKVNSPITIFYHGGGYTFGNRETYYFAIATLAESTKTIWLSVEYRLCPENKFPIPLTDCQSVLEYVAENKKLFSSEDAKLIICGESCGGHYCALLSNDYSHLIDYQILIYPTVSLTKSFASEQEFTKDCYLLVPELIEWNIRNLTNNQSLINTPILSPILKEDFSKIPETLLITAELDPKVDHSREYHKRLQESNVKSILKIVKGVHHGFLIHPVLMKNAFTELKEQIIDFFQNI